jgi:RHS repeat-associated protein
MISRVLLVLGVLVAGAARAMCTPFDLDAGNDGAVNGFLPDGGLAPDSTICCELGVDCEERCPSCSSVSSSPSQTPTMVSRPVDTLTGFAWMDRTDIEVAQPWGQPYRFARHYSTSEAERGAGTILGTGWSHTYSTSLSLSGPNPARRVILYMGERSGEAYNLINGTYSSDHGGRTLVWDAVTQLYLAGRNDGGTLAFDGAGRLRTMRSADGGEVQLRYTGEDAPCTASASLPAGALCRVDFLFDRQLWFSYASTGRLAGVALDAAQTKPVVTFGYFANGQLRSATCADGNAETYAYNFPHVSWLGIGQVSPLTQATDADGKLVESFSYAFDWRPSDGPARVVSHRTPLGTYTFSWEYLELQTSRVVRRTRIRSNKENFDLTFKNNVVSSVCYLDAAGNCDINRLHTYQPAPGSLDVRCEQTGSGEYFRHERDSAGRITTEYSGLAQCDTLTAESQRRATSYTYLGGTSLITSTSRTSVDPGAPVGFAAFDLSDYTSPASAIDPNCGNPSCQTRSAFNAAPLTTRVQRRVSIGRTVTDTNGTWGTQVQVSGFAFDSTGRLTSVDGPRRDVNDVTRYGYDATNRWAMASVTQPGRTATTRANHDARGNARSVIDEAGQTWVTNFDAVGRMTSLLQPGQSSATAWKYLPSGRVDNVTAPTGSFEKYEYDSDGQLATETRLAAAGSTQPDMVRAYTRVLKRLTKVKESEARVGIGPLQVRELGYDYDSQGRRTRTLLPGPLSGLVIGGSAMGIDDDERLVWRSDEGRFKPTDASPVQSHRYSYDDFGNITTVSQLVAGAWVTSSAFTWDAHGNLASTTDSKAVTIRYQHDDFDRLVEVESPDFGLRRYVYDEAGNLVKERRGDGAVVEYRYDASNRLIAVAQASTALETYDWGGTKPAVTNCAGGQGLPDTLAGGRLTHVRDAVGDWYFGYWPDGKLRYESLVSAGETCGKTFQWLYDGAGLLTAMVYPSGSRIEYGYPPAGALLHERPTSLTLVVGSTRTPLLSSIIWTQGEVTGYSTAAGAKWSLFRSLDATPRVVTAGDSKLRTQEFGNFDGWRNPNSIQESLWQQATAAQLHSLTHNDLPALSSAVGPGYSKEVYSYLASGDRKSANGNAYCYEAGTHRLALVSGTSRFTYTREGGVQRRVDSTGAISTWCYGLRGEVASTVGGGGDVSLLVTNFRRQRATEVWPINGLREDFRVDGSSRLLLESGVASLAAQYPRPTREYVWLGSHPVAVIESSEAADTSVTQKGVTYLYSGQLGEVLAETSSAGTPRRQYTYTPFGARQEATPPSEEVPTEVRINSAPGFVNLWGNVSAAAGSRAVKLHFTDASLAGCAITLRTPEFVWLADIASVATGDSTGWLPSAKVALEVKGCAGGGSSWRPTIGVTSQLGSYIPAPRSEATANPYPAAGQRFTLTLVQPSYLRLDAVALASCDMLEARDASGATVWQWKPGLFTLNGLVVPDTKAVTSRLQGAVDIGIWGKGCNATEAKAGFKVTEVLTEGGPDRAPPVSIGLPGQKYRYDGSIDNWYRQYSPVIGRYLQPEPLLQNPGYPRSKARGGLSAPVYAYAANNPLMYVDPDGRDLHMAWENYLLYSQTDIDRLQRVIDELNNPAGECACALQSQANGGDPAWKSRWISVHFDIGLSWLGKWGQTDPITGAIYVSSSLTDDQLKGTIAHEGGHLSWPFVHYFWDTDEEKQRKFNNPDYHCGGNRTSQSLHPRKCSCD